MIWYKFYFFRQKVKFTKTWKCRAKILIMWIWGLRMRAYDQWCNFFKNVTRYSNIWKRLWNSISIRKMNDERTMCTFIKIFATKTKAFHAAYNMYVKFTLIINKERKVGTESIWRSWFKYPTQIFFHAKFVVYSKHKRNWKNCVSFF